MRNLLIGGVLIVVVGGIAVWQKNQSLAPATNTTPSMTKNGEDTETSAPRETTKPAGNGITAGEVAMHNSGASCWATIGDNVYDLTSWIPKHPGGEQNILQLCGTDGTAKFERQHGRSSKVASVLAGFKIGSASN